MWDAIVVHARRMRVPVWSLVLVGAFALLQPADAEAQAAEKVYTADELTTLPKVASPSKMQRLITNSYPESLRRAGVAGRVQLQFVVGTDGKVEANSVEIMAASVAALGEAALGVAPQFEFSPGKVSGKPVRTLVMLPIRYDP